jgi:hypothetical protein
MQWAAPSECREAGFTNRTPELSTKRAPRIQRFPHGTGDVEFAGFYKNHKSAFLALTLLFTRSVRDEYRGPQSKQTKREQKEIAC